MKKTVIIKSFSPLVSEVEKILCNRLNEAGISFSVASVSELDNLNLTDAECAIVIGGDGTILSAGRALLGKNIPIFGVNTGHLGYLTATEPQKLTENLDKLINGNYTVEERVTLSLKVENKEYPCLNEAVFYRGNEPHLLTVDVKINGRETMTVHGDGVLISTPTGSTAYNLSAGGPIMAPTARSMVLTPICAHSLTARPVVLAENDLITVTVDGIGSDAKLSVDGVSVGTLTAEKSASVSIGKEKLLLARTEETSFYEILKKKLSGK